MKRDISVLFVLILNMLASSAAAQDAGLQTSPFFLPGTQPGELTKELRSPKVCRDCHGFYADYSANETWRGTMMANAARDPLFQAALSIANQDVEGSGDLCIRCHAPRAWLFGRSSPPTLDNFELEDFESVQCDFCHRLEPAEPLLIGTGQYTVADDFVRRGPIRDAGAPHDWVYSPYHESSELCGLCHDVSNPAENNFAIERTYTEWRNSAFFEENKTCQSCHMPKIRGQAAGNPGAPDRAVHQHELAGGNTWIPLVLAGEFPELGREDAYQRTADNARRMLQSSAKLELELPDEVEPGAELAFQLRVENLTGHKLPTGYPEGRLCWLEVEVWTDDGQLLLHSGAYDPETAERAHDEQLRTYEVKMAANGVEGFHFVLQDELLQDNRIPPRGFRPQPDTRPVGREYEVVSEDANGVTLAHWDQAPYRVDVPPQTKNLRVSARLWYQTASREYVEFLRDNNHTDQTGERLVQLYNRYDRSPPVEMAAVNAELSLGNQQASVDAGRLNTARDASVVLDAGYLAADASLRSDEKLDSAVRNSDSGDCSGLDASRQNCDIPRHAADPKGASACSCRAAGSETENIGLIWVLLALLVSYGRRRGETHGYQTEACRSRAAWRWSFHGGLWGRRRQRWRRYGRRGRGRQRR